MSFHISDFVRSGAVHCFVLAAKLTFQNGFGPGEMEQLCTQLHIGYSRCKHKALFPGDQVWIVTLSVNRAQGYVHIWFWFVSAAPKFQQADYPISQLDEQFTYVDFADIKWDPVSESWRQIPYAK